MSGLAQPARQPKDFSFTAENRAWADGEVDR